MDERNTTWPTPLRAIASAMVRTIRALGREEIGDLINRRDEEVRRVGPAKRRGEAGGVIERGDRDLRSARRPGVAPGAIADDDADRLLRVEQGGGCGPARVTRDPRDGNHGGLPGCAWPF